MFSLKNEHLAARFFTFSALFLMFLTSTAAHAEPLSYLILESSESQKEVKIQGDETLLNKRFSPASTFKMVIAWAALEERIIKPDKTHPVTDKHVPGSPRKIDLHEALYYSSNDYFIWLARKIGRERLKSYLIQSSFTPDQPDRNWPGSWKDVIHGGEITVNATDEHSFIRRLMMGSLSSYGVQEELLNVLRWPSKDPSTVLYGKTGSWGGVVWFNGFGIQEGKRKAVTVLIQGAHTLRPKAIELFYREFGLTFDPEWRIYPGSRNKTGTLTEG